jgi:hypothetical protein
LVALAKIFPEIFAYSNLTKKYNLIEVHILIIIESQNTRLYDANHKLGMKSQSVLLKNYKLTDLYCGGDRREETLSVSHPNPNYAYPVSCHIYIYLRSNISIGYKKNIPIFPFIFMSEEIQRR